MQQQLTRLRGGWGAMPQRAQLAIVGVAAVTILVMFFVVRAATGTEWVAATDGQLSSEKVGEAQTVLEEGGIENRVSESGSAVEVPAASKPKAAALLIPAGIAAKGNRTGCATQSEKGSSLMAQTSAQHALMLETCRESQAANTIEGVDGIEKATVDVTLPGKSLFAEEEQSAKASVAIDTGGEGLSKQAIKGVQATVASSFEGLDTQAVTVTDESGAVVGGDEDADGEGGVTKLDAESKLNAKIEAELGDKIRAIVGENNIVLTSNVELDWDKINREVVENEAAGENGEPLPKTEIKDVEILNETGEAGVEGPAGTASNQGNDGEGVDGDDRTVTADPAADAPEDPNYLAEKGTVEYANNVVAEAIDVAQGAVTRFRLGVVVDDDVDPEAANAVKDVIQAWMGGNAQDSLAFNQAPISIADQKAADTGAAATTKIAGYVKWALLGLGLIGLAFVLRRSLTQRTAELLAPADDLLLLDSGDFMPIPIAELEAALVAGQPDAERRTRIEMQKRVERIADSKPHDVANELRRWMNQDDVGYAPAGQRKAG